jgi:hypothetical protein
MDILRAVMVFVLVTDILILNLLFSNRNKTESLGNSVEYSFD